MNHVRTLRESKNLTQTELAQKSGLSLRTIQRIEAGNAPKGFTLRALCDALEIAASEINPTPEKAEISRAKTINFSVLTGLVIPFASVIVPLILTYKTKDETNKEIGKNIVALQLLLSILLSVTMIICPFLQLAFHTRFPLFIAPLILFLALKTIVVIKNGISLNQTGQLSIKLKTNFL